MKLLSRIFGLFSAKQDRPFFHGPLCPRCSGHTTLVAPPRWRCGRCGWLSPVLGREWNNGRNGMKIETKYDIGHTYWVARVYKKFEKETKIIDGKVYTHEYEYLLPLAKKKRITGITILLNEDYSGRIFYNISNFDEIENTDQIMGIDNYEKMFDTENEALDFAKQYKDDKKIELFYVPSDIRWESI